MKRSLAILVVLCVGASPAWADPPRTAANAFVSYVAARDNKNDTNDNANHGADANGRLAKWKQENVYADWSEADLLDLAGVLASAPPAPYTGWEVHYEVTAPCWNGNDPSYVAWTEVFYSSTDWAEMEATHLQAAAGVDWNGTSGTTFWDLPALVNSVPINPYTCTPAPSDPLYQTGVVLDDALVQALISDPDARGVRTWTNIKDQNHQAYMTGQWGLPGVAPRLAVYAVPEPMTMLLIAVGGVGLFVRKRR